MAMRSTTVQLRMPLSLFAAIEALATREGISVEQFIVTAAAEKLAMLQGAEINTAERFFAERRGHGDQLAALRFLQREGGEPPRAGDELPAP